MAWIDEIEAEDASGELKQIYEHLIAKRGKVSNIMKVHSLNPSAMQKHLDLYLHLLFGRSKLSRSEREAIAVAVSSANECKYCIGHHAEALSRYDKDEQPLGERITTLRFDGLSSRMAAMLAYAVKLTRSPGDVSEEDVSMLRSAGLADNEILDVALVTSYFNFVNRIALGLGVGWTEEEISGYKV